MHINHFHNLLMRAVLQEIQALPGLMWNSSFFSCTINRGEMKSE